MSTTLDLRARAGGRPLPLLAAGTGAIVLAAGVVAVLATRHAPATALSPIVPHGNWRTAWIAALAIAYASYGVAMLVARAATPPLVVAVTLAVAIQVVPLSAPLLLSRDVYHYWSQGRIVAVHRANPYVVTPSNYPHDPATSHVAEIWRAQPAPYGPVWEMTGAVAAPFRSARAAELLFRAIAAAALVASVALIARRTRSSRAVAILGWNPVVAIHYAGGGHNDAVMMLLVLAAIGSTTAAAGALWPLAGAIKPFPAILLPLELARRRVAFPRRWWIGLTAAVLVVLGVSTALFGTHWIHAATTGAHETSPIGGVHWLTKAGLRHRYAVLVGALVFAAVYLVLLRSAWRTGRARFSLAASALCLTSSLLRPWYALWPVALAALEDDALAALVAYALTGYLLFSDAVPL